MIKALFFDIDGTLISFKTHTIPASTIEALEAAHQKGIKVFISTGRPPQIMNNLTALQEKNLIDGYVSMNGGYCFVGDEVIYKSPICKEDVMTLVDHCRTHNFPCIFVGEKKISVCQPNETTRKIFYDFLRVKEFPIYSFEEATSYETYQMTPFFSLEEEEKLAPSMPGSEFGRWHPAFVDITAKGNTKQKGIEHMLQYFHLDTSEIMAFGDGGNDISMLRYAGIGVAMGNATDNVKAVADYITTTVDEDGILSALKHFQVL